MKTGPRTSPSLIIACLAALMAANGDGLSAQPLDAKDITPARTEHKRAASEGKLPLPGTPDLSRTGERISQRGIASDASMMIRIFKAESELEIWLSRGAGYTLFATYPICYWSGTLGPKVKEGDRQAPEGFYTVTLPQAYPNGARHPLALNIGYPNSFDQLHSRSGSYILIHGGCASIGCFAMTDAVNKEIRMLTLRALDAGQVYVPIHVFPFRMTAENIVHFDQPDLRSFWANLKEGYDVFERTHRPPRVSVCKSRYTFEGTSALESANPGPIEVCQETKEILNDIARINTRVLVQEDAAPVPGLTKAALGVFPYRESILRRFGQTRHGENSLSDLAQERLGPVNPALTRPVPCSLALPACRKYAVLRERLASASVEAVTDESPPAKHVAHRRTVKKKRR
jgi:murein L,D-transpeptidase YafK